MGDIGRIAWKMSRRPVPLAWRQVEAPSHWPRIPCESLLSYMRQVFACQSRYCRNLRGEERHSLDRPHVEHSVQIHSGLPLSRRDRPRRRQEIRSIVPPGLRDHHFEDVQKRWIMRLFNVALVPKS